jgi:hypothetical protein
MRMTNRQFDAAVDLIVQQNIWPDSERDAARIICAACFVIKKRRGIPDDVGWNAPPELELMAMVREFLSGITSRQRRLLKSIAEDLELQSERLH